jgi:hypothetical protein
MEDSTVARKECESSMTNISKITFGGQQRFVQTLHGAGFTLEDAQRIIKEPELASKMFRAIELSLRLPRSVVSTQQPAWYVSPERQLERVKRFDRQRDWGFEESEFPTIPEDASLCDGEVLLLCVYLRGQRGKGALERTFDELWYLFEPPTGYTKWRWEELKSTAKLLRQAPGYDWKPGLRWVVFSPNAYRGKSPEQALRAAKLDNVQLAGVEVLMANLLFPDWATSWNGQDSLYPWCSGLQFRWNSGWSRVPCLDRWDDGRRLELDASPAGGVDGYWSSPVVRECEN